jgi:hypothetical protein
VIGDGHGGHVQLGGAPHQSVDFTGTVEQAVIGMQV